jgi:hypothetical protein
VECPSIACRLPENTTRRFIIQLQDCLICLLACLLAQTNCTAESVPAADWHVPRALRSADSIAARSLSGHRPDPPNRPGVRRGGFGSSFPSTCTDLIERDHLTNFMHLPSLLYATRSSTPTLLHTNTLAFAPRLSRGANILTRTRCNIRIFSIGESLPRILSDHPQIIRS